MFHEKDVPPPKMEHHNDSIVRLVVFLYRHSWVRKRLHRHSKNVCFFVPSCSEYAILATRKYGFIRGLIVIGGRFRRCSGGYQGDYLDFP